MCKKVENFLILGMLGFDSDSPVMIYDVVFENSKFNNDINIYVVRSGNKVLLTSCKKESLVLISEDTSVDDDNIIERVYQVQQ